MFIQITPEEYRTLIRCRGGPPFDERHGLTMVQVSREEVETLINHHRAVIENEPPWSTTDEVERRNERIAELLGKLHKEQDL